MTISALLYAGGGLMFLFFPRTLLQVLDFFAGSSSQRLPHRDPVAIHRNFLPGM